MVKRAEFLMALLVAATLPTLCAANTPAVSATVSGYYATAPNSGAIPESDWQAISVTRNDRPGHAEARGEGGRAIGYCTIPCVHGLGRTSASVKGFASAEAGVLRVYGSNLAVVTPSVSGPNEPFTPNNDSALAQISASASFTDYLTVSVPDLAIGAPVSVPMRFVVEMVGTPGLGYPPFSAHPIAVYARFDIPGLGPQIFNSESNLSSFRSTTLPNGNTLYAIRSDVINLPVRVGDVLPISAVFRVNGTARVDPLNPNIDYPFQQFGAFIDGRNTAGIWLGNLPAGMVVTSASGHDYRIDPTAAVVPEPASLVLLLAGLVALGLAARRQAVDQPGSPSACRTTLRSA